MLEFSILLEFKSKMFLEKNFCLVAPDWFSFLTVVEKKGKHTGIWTTHINLEYFGWEEKIFLWKERREYIVNNWTDFLLENEISELCIKNNVIIMLM